MPRKPTKPKWKSKPKKSLFDRSLFQRLVDIGRSELRLRDARSRFFGVEKWWR
jgi:hypothetical protein